MVALLHLGTGCLLDAAIGPYQGKDTSEIAMLCHLLSSRYKNDGWARGETGVNPFETDQLCVDLSVRPFELGRCMLFRLESR